MRDLVARIVRHPREPALLTEVLQVAGGLLVFRALLVEIAHALVGFGAEVLAALRDEGVEVDLWVLLLPGAAELMEIGELFDNVLADLPLQSSARFRTQLSIL